jgi:hypothetical protein
MVYGMKRLSQFNIRKGLILLFVAIGIILVYYAFPVYYNDGLHVQAQLQIQQLPQQQKPQSIISVKITYPSTGQQVPAGELTIVGRSTDNTTSDCTVYADWNSTKPFQKATATGPDGVDDYSTWAFTYTDKYHLITNGTNNLTSKLSCLNNNGATANITKSYSVNVIGIREPSQRLALSAGEERNNLNGSVSSSPLPPIKENNNTNTATKITSPESIPSVPITPSPSPSSPSIREQKPEDNDNVGQKESQLQPAPRDTQDSTIYWDIQ